MNTYYLVFKISSSYRECYWVPDISELQLQLFENDEKTTGQPEAPPNSTDYKFSFKKLMTVPESENFYLLLDNPESMDGK